MQPSRTHSRGRFSVVIALVLAFTGLQAFVASPAQADVSTKIATFPYVQDWSNADLITANDNWSGVPGVQGYLGDDSTTTTAGVDPQTRLAQSWSTTTDVVANASATSTAGGAIEVQGDTIAIQGSGTADAPNLVFHLDLTDQTGVELSFDARDLDASADDAVQQIAVQYRIGGTGDYTNLPVGYIADATTGGAAGQVTERDVALPAAVEGQASVFVRVITTNAAGNDELVGIDNIAFTTDTGQLPLTAADPGDKTALVGQAIAPFTLSAGGGTSPYTWSDQTPATLPPGVTVASNGQVSGTPTAPGTYEVALTVTDSAAPTPATDTVTFTFTIYPAAGATNTIAEIQGTGASTQYVGQTVTTSGLVTAAYPIGGLNGFYLQTPGADTPNASDALFVYGGTGGFATYPALGDAVQVTGTAGEFGGQTQITATDSGVTSVALSGNVTPKTTVPGTDCAEGACASLADLAAAREAMEGELLKPTAPWTVTDTYDFSPFWPGTSFSSGFFGEIGLAAHSADPLVTPTELYDAQTQAGQITARKAYNDAHRIVLDDGSSLNYATAANTDEPFPWLTADHVVRVDAGVSFPQPVVFTEGFGRWRILPSTRVTGAPSPSQPQFEQTRAANTAPQDVGGDLKMATFNVLNFFPTTGEEYEAAGGGNDCTYFNDREGNPITTDDCGNPTSGSGNGPRGAANEVNLARQRDKIVAAINGSGADIVSLEELENSVKFGKPRDVGIDALVSALNTAAGAGTWAAVASPPAAELPPTAEQDVIRNGFIYKPVRVALVGASRVLVGSAAFNNARQPLAQVFKMVGSADADAFAVIVNHFKSKGSGVDDGTGQGNANPDRVAQANALVAFADQFKTDRGISRVFLAGDFNAYTHEDPIQVLNAAGYTNLESSSDPHEETYNFDGQIGSLDHVLANAAALPDVTGVDVWAINAYESVYYEYSRFNYNVTNLYNAGPFRSSDHNPEIVGISVAEPVVKADPDIDIKVVPGSIKAGKTKVKLIVQVKADGVHPVNGEVRITVQGKGTVTLQLKNGRAVWKLGVFDSAGQRDVTVTYLGNNLVNTGTEKDVITVKP